MTSRLLFSTILVISIVTAQSLCAGEVSDADREFFERRIRPLLHEHCYECHSADAKTVHGGLLLDTADAIAVGGDSGPTLVAGKPDESLLIIAIRYHDDDVQMPPQGRMTETQIETLETWVRRGAPYPVSKQPESPQSTVRATGIDYDKASLHWAFVPAIEQTLPTRSNPSSMRGRIDRFVAATLNDHSLHLSPEADRRTLIRRVTFGLTGLPPTWEEVQAFVADERPDAYRRLVERLLASPAYGERWGRIWLDLARYTDTTASWLYQSSESFYYRDWVIASLNDDLPYDDFIRRQLATDLIDSTGPEDHAALGFLGLSPTYWKELKLPMEIIKVIVADEWEERVDAVSKTFLGLTIACARCHDHKFDAISMDDYYAMAGVIANSRQSELPLVSAKQYAPVKQAKAKVEALTKQIAALEKKKPKPEEQIHGLQKELAELKKTPGYDMPMVAGITDQTLHVVRAGKKPEDGTRLEYNDDPLDLPRFIRGNPNRPGHPVPRRFLRVLSQDPAATFQYGSGRKELANAITNDARSLVARVIVNRIWLAHFGRGIVTTPSNFGVQGDRPSHPQLLDDLAARFIAGGWSLKQLHREIVLSSTYRQSSADNHVAAQIDPENKWLWRQRQVRLDVESWRDAMLFVTGELDRKMGGKALEIEQNANHRRTVYARVHRRDMSKMLQIHDFPDPTAHSAQRIRTTTALQGLYVLNSPQIANLAESLAQRLNNVSEDSSARVDSAYRWLFHRTPSAYERQLGLEFLGDGNSAEVCQQYAHALLGSNEFMFLD